MRYICIKVTRQHIGFFLLSAIISQPQLAAAWFAFGQDNYHETTLPWESGDMTIAFPISLQSCNGLDPDSGWFNCNWYEQAETYFLTGSNFTLILQDKDNPSDPDLDISRVVFNDGSKNTDITNQETQPGLMPGSYKPVDAKVTFTINHTALSLALPGTYRSSFGLQGEEREGIQTFTRNTKFIFDINVPTRVKISGLKDIVLQSDGNSTIRSQWEPFCVFSQGGDTFKLRAFGSDDSGAFILQQGAEPIGYDLLIRSITDGGKQNIQPDKATALYQWPGSNSQDCIGYTQNNMELRVRISDAGNAAAGVYTDTVTIVVEPG